METLTNYGIIAGNFILEYYMIIFLVIYAVFMLYYQYKYYKEQRKNSLLTAEMKAHETIADSLIGISTKLIQEKEKLSKQLKSLKQKRNNNNARVMRYKRYFYAYDFARTTHFGESIEGKIFYNSYLKAKSKTMKELSESFSNSRKKLAIKNK